MSESDSPEYTDEASLTPEPFMYHENTYVFERFLGRGTFGQVALYCAISKKAVPDHMAVKLFLNNSDEVGFKSEVRISVTLSKAVPDSVVHVYGFKQSANERYTCIVFSHSIGNLRGFVFR